MKSRKRSRAKFRLRFLHVVAALFALLLAAAMAAYALRHYGHEPWVDHVDIDRAPSPEDLGNVHYTVATSHPRILLNDASVSSRLKLMLQQRSKVASRFKEMVDAHMSGTEVFGFEPWFAAMVYRMTGDALYARYAVMLTDAAVTAEENLIASGRAPLVARDSYLYVSNEIGSLAVVYDWCHDSVSASQRTHWIEYANQAVFNVWHPRQARWGDRPFRWSGWSVNNPSNNYYYSFLYATALLGLATKGENDRAQAWLDAVRVDKLEKQLFPTFERDLQGGGSREGTGYGVAMYGLFQIYDWWQHSTGERLADRTSHTLASMAHMIHSTAPSLDRVAPTGDHSRESAATLFDYHRGYMLLLMAMYPGERMTGIAQTYLASSSVPEMAYAYNLYLELLYGGSDGKGPAGIEPRPLEELATTYRGAGTGQLMMRSSWSRDATFANFICGPNTESHAHRDQGSFVIHRKRWLAEDANTHSHSGLERTEAFHNLVRFDIDAGFGSPRWPVTQGTGRACTLETLADNPLFTFASADATRAYLTRLVVTQARRDFLFIKPHTFVVFDRTATLPGVRRTWTLNVPEVPTVAGNRFWFGDGANRFDVSRLSPLGIDAVVVPWTSASAAGEMSGGYRVDELDDGVEKDAPFLHVIGTGASVVRAQRDDAPGRVGAEIVLADGRRAVVRFDLKRPGGTLELVAPGGESLFKGDLPTGVEALPLYADHTR